MQSPDYERVERILIFEEFLKYLRENTVKVI